MSYIITDYTPARDIATLLNTLDYGSIGVDIHVHREPDGDEVLDNVITVYDTSPWRPPELEYSWEYPSCQIRVRRKAGNKETAKAAVLAIMDSLHAYTGSVGSNTYHLIRVVNGPVDIGEDDRGRSRFTFNIEMHRST
jgi:hypothetical protein